MADGSADMDAWIAKLRGLKGLVREAMPDLVQATDQRLRATAAAGTDPDGAAWKPKKDGGRPLVHAAEKINVRALGLTIVAVITGPEAIHHYGTKKDPRRGILPTRGGLTTSLAAAYRSGLITRFKKRMGAR